MTEGPLVSVVIPALNAERFIGRTLRSAMAQTYANLEIVVVDDGSTDGTKRLAQAAAEADSRVRVISIANGGVANARNVGIENSSGPLIAFLDADDLWHSAKLELQVSSLTDARGTRAVASYALHRLIDVDDRVIHTNHGFVCNGYVFARHLYAKFVGNGSSLLVRRQAILAVGGFEPSWAHRGLGGCEDLDFELKLTAKYPIVAVPQYLVGYRAYPGNMSSDRLRMSRAVVATIEHHLEKTPAIPQWAKRMARTRTHQYALYLMLADRNWRGACVEFAKIMRTEPARAFEFVAKVPYNRIAKLRRRIQQRTVAASDRAFFGDHGPDIAPVSFAAASRRDERNMKRLAKLDAVASAGLGFTEETLPEPMRRQERYGLSRSG